MITACVRSLFVAAFVLAAFLPQVPAVQQVWLIGGCLVALGAGLWLVLRTARQRAALMQCGLLLFTLLWAVGWGSWQLQNRLDPALEGRDLWVEGRIDGLVTRRERSTGRERTAGDSTGDSTGDVTGYGTGYGTGRVIQRFNFAVDKAADEQGNPLAPFPTHLRLSVYDGPAMLGGEGWRLQVRLKRPHGFANPGGFDYERWLLSRSIGATGYVRVQVVPDAGWPGVSRLPMLDSGFQRWRENLRQDLMQRFGEGRSTAVLLALSIGDLSLLGREDSLTAQQLGLIHLLTISGLHVGLAGVIGFWLGRALGAVLSLAFPLRVYGPHCAWLGAVLVAVGYGAVAGYSLATQRSVIVLVVGAIWFCCYRRYSVWLGWWVSMMAVLLWHPLSVLEPGFWFSFIAVAILLVLLARPAPGWRGKLWLLVKLQCVLFLFMGALQVFWGMGVSGVSPLVNLLAVPYVSVLVVPPIVLALLLSVLGDAAQLVWQVVHWLINGFWWGLDQFQPVAAELLYMPSVQVSVSIVLLACLGLCLAMLPLPAATRLLGLVAVTAVVLPPLRHHPLPTVTILDVGQGLAVLVGSENRWLLYDTGPGLSEEFDTGAAVVLPYLFAQGIGQLELGVISHWDQDHSGGFVSVQGGVGVTEWFSGGAPPVWAQRTGVNFGECQQDSRRQLGEWTVSVLANDMPTSGPAGRMKNNLSCVLLLEAAGMRVLLPGDIEKDRERSLLNHPALAQPVDIVVAPHHGSGTSSSPAWVAQLSPRWVVFSAGYRNRYRHPQQGVVERYRQAGAELWYTSQSGAVSFTGLPAAAGADSPLADTPRLRITAFRDDQPRYWR